MEKQHLLFLKSWKVPGPRVPATEHGGDAEEPGGTGGFAWLPASSRARSEERILPWQSDTR